LSQLNLETSKAQSIPRLLGNLLRAIFFGQSSLDLTWTISWDNHDVFPNRGSLADDLEVGCQQAGRLIAWHQSRVSFLCGARGHRCQQGASGKKGRARNIRKGERLGTAALNANYP
jgi:hypothetical protein